MNHPPAGMPGRQPVIHLVETPATRLRLQAALDCLRDTPAFAPPSAPVTIVAASRAAADDLARAATALRPATMGWTRLSLSQLAARSALFALAASGRTLASRLGVEAVSTRAAFDARQTATLDYLAPVAGTPGFPVALARALADVRAAGVTPEALGRLPLAGPDLARLLDAFERHVADAGAADVAEFCRVATRHLTEQPLRGTVVLLDIAAETEAERQLVRAIVRGADRVLATVAPGDEALADLYRAAGAVALGTPADTDDDLGRVRRYLFDSDAPPSSREADGALELFSAPGEGRECVEIARRLLREARRGVPFDRMAIVLRAPQQYLGLLEHALRRAGVPAWFDRGTRRPHPAGRAFLALLACAAERLSALRFGEYLSLGQVPPPVGVATAPWYAGEDLLGRTADGELSPSGDGSPSAPEASALTGDGDTAAMIGTLHAPWRWEQFLIDAEVIGGGSARWRRRLDGVAAEFERRVNDARREGNADTDPAVARLETQIDQLGYLRAFALPIIETLEPWTDAVPWGAWLDRLSDLAPRVLRRPEYVLRVLTELRPMAAVGPVRLDEVRRVLAERLLTVAAEPPARREGRVFVATPLQLRGRSFAVVFVPGLAERIFPQKGHEDPLLLDALRAELNRALPTPLPLRHERLSQERQALRLAAGAAESRLVVSYPRIDQNEARARVPSFYALDLVQATTGQVPNHEELEAKAGLASGALLAWPAPAEPDDAIDEQEHDLAVLRRLLDAPDAEAVKGHAHYLLALNEPLRRSVIARWSRGGGKWTPHDGLIRRTDATAAALAKQRPSARAYSLSALQKFAACPYQFVLSAIFRLQPLALPEPLQRMNPLTRGSLAHEMYATTLRTLREQGALPVTAASRASAGLVLDETIAAVATAAYERLAPAVERVWQEEIAAMRRDLHGWLDRLVEEGDEWVPRYFEFAFGSVPGERDPASLPDPVTIEGGFQLRGAIDLIEEHRVSGELRVTDFKTGRPPDGLDALVVDGGRVLQPVLYGVAVEAGLHRRVREGRLFYTTVSGGFRSHAIPLDAGTRRAGLAVLDVVERAVGAGFLAPAPEAKTCERCDYRAVCGTDVYRRLRRKPSGPLDDLAALRAEP